MNDTVRLTHPYTSGQHVVSIQALLAKHRCLRGKIDGVYGPLTYGSVRTFQAKHRCYVDGIVGPETWAALHRIDDPVKITPAIIARYVVQHKAGIHYTQNMKLRMIGITWKIYLPNVPKWFDCSSFVTWLFFAAKRPDPNGPKFGYNGYGYSQTLFAHGRAVNIKEILPNDLVFYGHAAKPAPVTTHVAVAVGNGLVVSMGQTGGPYQVPIRYRSDIVGVKRYGD